MSDLTPPTPPASGVLAGMGEAERQALLASLTDAEKRALGITVDAILPPATTPAPPAGPIGIVQGVHEATFTTRGGYEPGSVALVVDGDRYRCAAEAPVDALVAVLEAQKTGDRIELVLAIRQLIDMVMYPDDRERYRARARGVVMTEPTDGTEPQALPSIGPEAMLHHGLFLTEAYLGGKSGAPPSSGDGGATQSTPPPSTGGAWPAA